MTITYDTLILRLSKEETCILHTILQNYIDSFFNDPRNSFLDVKFAMAIRDDLRRNDIKTIPQLDMDQIREQINKLNTKFKEKKQRIAA